MNGIKWLVALAILFGAYSLWSAHQNKVVLRDAGMVVNEYGFTPLPFNAEGQKTDTVYVIAAQNCSREEAARADLLAATLQANGFPVERVHRLGFEFEEMPPKAIIRRLNELMAGELPLVMINGLASNNPTFAETLQQFEEVQTSFSVQFN